MGEEGGGQKSQKRGDIICEHPHIYHVSPSLYDYFQNNGLNHLRGNQIS